MSIDFDNHYEPQYINIRGKGPLINALKKEAKNAKKVYLASDPDREGEAISWHLSHILGLDPDDNNRVVFNEITKDAVKEALKAQEKLIWIWLTHSRHVVYWIVLLVIPFRQFSGKRLKRGFQQGACNRLL